MKQISSKAKKEVLKAEKRIEELYELARQRALEAQKSKKSEEANGL